MTDSEEKTSGQISFRGSREYKKRVAQSALDRDLKIQPMVKQALDLFLDIPVGVYREIEAEAARLRKSPATIIELAWRIYRKRLDVNVKNDLQFTSPDSVIQVPSADKALWEMIVEQYGGPGGPEALQAMLYFVLERERAKQSERAKESEKRINTVRKPASSDPHKKHNGG